MWPRLRVAGRRIRAGDGRSTERRGAKIVVAAVTILQLNLRLDVVFRAEDGRLYVMELKDSGITRSSRRTRSAY